MTRILMLSMLLLLAVTPTTGAEHGGNEQRESFILTVPGYMLPALAARLDPDWVDPFAVGLDYVDLFLVKYSDGTEALIGYDQDDMMVLYKEL